MLSGYTESAPITSWPRDHFSYKRNIFKETKTSFPNSMSSTFIRFRLNFEILVYKFFNPRYDWYYVRLWQKGPDEVLKHWQVFGLIHLPPLAHDGLQTASKENEAKKKMKLWLLTLLHTVLFTSTDNMFLKVSISIVVGSASGLLYISSPFLKNDAFDYKNMQFPKWPL